MNSKPRPGDFTGAQRLRPPPSLAGLLFRITLARLGAALGAIVFPWVVLGLAIGALWWWLASNPAHSKNLIQSPTVISDGDQG